MEVEATLERLDRSMLSRDRLLRIVRHLDKQYIPPISSQVGDLFAYAGKMSAHAENVIARVDDTDIGFVSCYANDVEKRVAFVTSIGVDAAYHGRGIGQRLLQQAERIARANDMRCIRLEVDRTNRRAVRFYQKQGYSEVETPASPRLPKSICMTKWFSSESAP